MPVAARYILSYCASIVMVGAAGCGDTRVVVARVDRNAIYAAEVDHWIPASIAADGQRSGDRSGLRERALSFLIFARWLIGEASELGVQTSDGAARKQLSLLRFDQIEGRRYEGLPRDLRLRTLLTAPGLSTSDRLWLMKLSMLATHIEQIRLSQAQREVTESQIVKYYDENRSRLIVPETRDVESVMTKREASARKAKREIESGKSFLSVANRVNVSPEGGLHVGLVRGAGEPTFERVVFNARPHVLLGPVEQQLFYVFKVLKVTPEREQTLAQAQAEIRWLLTARHTLPRLMKMIAARRASRTTCVQTARIC